LIDRIGPFLADGLERGEAVLVLARPHLRERLGARLPAAAPGQTVFMDARAALDGIIIGGAPDDGHFAEVIGCRVEDLLGHFGGLRIYGEMVDLLAETGLYDEAARLEALWNDLSRASSFALLCGYRLSHFSGMQAARAFVGVCDAHHAVWPALDEDLEDPERGRRILALLHQQTADLRNEVHERRASERRLRQNHAVVAALSQSVTSADVAQVAMRELYDLVGAQVGLMHLLGADGSLEVFASRGLAPTDTPPETLFAATNRQPVFTDTHAALPLRFEQRMLAVMSFRFELPRDFGEADRDFLLGLADQFGQALERARLFEMEQRGRERLAFLAEASELLASSLDYEATLGHVLQLALPVLGDFGHLDVIEANGSVRRLMSPADADPEKLTHQTSIVAKLAARGQQLGTLTLYFGSSGRRHDASDLKLAEELARRAAAAIENARLLGELREAIARREQADRRKDEFLAMLGHELRNPLAPIMTAVELMKLRGGFRAERERQVIERQSRHLLRLVDDLLDVSRITRGKVQLRREPVEMSLVVAKGIEIASPLLEQRRHQLSVAVPAEGLVAHVDVDRMAQVLANLLTNAAKYTPSGGQVRVTAAQEGESIVVRIRDNGMGIAKEMLGRMFDLFVQGQRTIDRSEGGLGIGLMLVRSLTEMHGGTVSAHSEGHGHGSEFVVRLPAQNAAPVAQPPKRADNTPAGVTSKVRVLVVDDNEDAAITIADVLGELGYEVEVAHDGPKALDCAGRFEPDVVVLDLGLPVMDGFEVARRLRTASSGRTMPRLVALSGYGQDVDKANSRAAGFDVHLVKPVDIAQLQAALDG
jgi:signal transduction histidine kinase